jgi:hypothetical protein
MTCTDLQEHVSSCPPDQTDALAAACNRPSFKFQILYTHLSPVLQAKLQLPMGKLVTSNGLLTLHFDSPEAFPAQVQPACAAAPRSLAPSGQASPQGRLHRMFRPYTQPQPHTPNRSRPSFLAPQRAPVQPRSQNADSQHQSVHARVQPAASNIAAHRVVTDTKAGCKHSDGLHSTGSCAELCQRDPQPDAVKFGVSSAPAYTFANDGIASWKDKRLAYQLAAAEEARRANTAGSHESWQFSIVTSV